jgi:hypothetical protein
MKVREMIDCREIRNMPTLNGQGLSNRRRRATAVIGLRSSTGNGLIPIGRLKPHGAAASAPATPCPK